MNTKAFHAQSQWHDLTLKRNIVTNINDQLPLHYRMHLVYNDIMQEPVWSTRFQITDDDFKTVCQRNFFADVLNTHAFPLGDIKTILDAYRTADTKEARDNALHQFLSAVNVIIEQAHLHGFDYPINLVVDYIDKLSIDVYREYICNFYQKSLDQYQNSERGFQDLRLFYEQSLMMVIGMLVCRQLPETAQGVKQKYQQYLSR